MIRSTERVPQATDPAAARRSNEEDQKEAGRGDEMRCRVVRRSRNLKREPLSWQSKDRIGALKLSQRYAFGSQEGKLGQDRRAAAF